LTQRTRGLKFQPGAPTLVNLMAAATDPFVAHILELLAPLGNVRARKMFGGWGISCDGISIGLVAWERLYLKVDATTKPNFREAGCEPFIYDGKNRPIEMSYWTVPPDAMDAPHLMAPWARLAMQAALTAANAKAAKPATPAKKLARKAAKNAARKSTASKPAVKPRRAR
jgi:DNA transformation protein and related proteins